MERPEIGEGIKRKTNGMEIFQEIIQEEIFIRNLLRKNDKGIL